jgi:predicted amidohydrolase
MTDFDVALCQYALGEADSIAAFQRAATALFDRAGDADLYVLPELALSDLRVRGEATPVAETALTPDEVASYHDFLQTAARERDAVVVGGSYNVVVADDAGTAGDGDPEDPADWTQDDDRPLVNRAPVATPDGLDCYVKVQPTPNERSVGKSCGTGSPVLVDHAGVTVGVVVCYDVEFPELVREAVDAGAEVLAVPSWTAGDAGAERVARCAAARAIENQCYVASVPLVGSRGDKGGVGRSRVFAPCDDVCGPHGTRLELPWNQRAAATSTLDVDAVRESRESAEVRPYTDYQEGN